MNAITVYAAALLVLGGALLFAPEAMSARTNPTVVEHVLFAFFLLASVLGFAAANWMVRHAPRGGIYGRAVVVGNLGFSLVGSLALLGSAPSAPGPGFWVLGAVLAGGTLLHGRLLMRGSRAESPSPTGEDREG